MSRAVLQAGWPALLVAAAALAPFLGKAFTVDDTLFLRVAEHALRAPFSPTAFQYTWSDQPERMSALLASGPVGGYLLVPTILAGGAEWVAHLTWWALLAVAILATVSLAMRLGLSPRYAGLAGLLVASAPAVLTMASTNMPDVPALALGTLGMERLAAWRDERRWHQALLATLALGLAPLARSQTILLWPLSAVVLFGSSNPLGGRRWKELPLSTWLPLLATPLLTWAAMRLTADPQHPGGFVDAMHRFTSWNRKNTVAWALQYALTMPLCAAWIALRLRHLRAWQAVLFVAVAAAAWSHLASMGQEEPLVLALPAALTALVLMDVGRDAWRRRDAMRGMLLGWALVSLPTVAYLHMSPKYFVPSAPAVALLVVLAARDSGARWATWALGTAGGAGVVFGLAIMQADARYAELGRRAARELVGPHAAQGEQVWFAGHWGFQWYAERAGGRILSLTAPHPLPGDILVAGLRTDGSDMARLFPRRQVLRTIAEERPGGRIMSSGAGFYSNEWGYLPWAWGADVAERFDAWRLE